LDRKIAANPPLDRDTGARLLRGSYPGRGNSAAGQPTIAGGRPTLPTAARENASPFAIATRESFGSFLVQIVSLRHMHSELGQGSLLQLYEIFQLTPTRMRLFVPEVARMSVVRRRNRPFRNHGRRWVHTFKREPKHVYPPCLDCRPSVLATASESESGGRIRRGIPGHIR
jgi:hypothetical protein